MKVWLIKEIPLIATKNIDIWGKSIACVVIVVSVANIYANVICANSKLATNKSALLIF